MNPETLRILESIARDRNIEREQLIRDLEMAMMSAARKHFNSLETEEFGCEMDRLTGKIRIWRNLEDGGQEEVAIEKLGRIPAQTAKQAGGIHEARRRTCNRHRYASRGHGLLGADRSRRRLHAEVGTDSWRVL